MKIDIVPVEESKLTSVEGKARGEITESAIVVPESTSSLEDIFAKFLQLEVGDGAASEDTIRNYLSQTKQYLSWCRDNLLPPTKADSEDIKLYRQQRSAVGIC